MVCNNNFHTELVRARDRPNISNARVYCYKLVSCHYLQVFSMPSTFIPYPLVVAVRNIIFKIRAGFFQEVMHQHGARLPSQS